MLCLLALLALLGNLDDVMPHTTIQANHLRAILYMRRELEAALATSVPCVVPKSNGPW
jgi:hypothetical protein